MNILYIVVIFFQVTMNNTIYATKSIDMHLKCMQLFNLWLHRQQDMNNK